VNSSISDLKIWSNSVEMSLQNPDPKILAEQRDFEELVIFYSIKTKNFEELENGYKRLRLFNEGFGNLKKSDE